MTLGQSDVYELLDAIRAGGDIDMIRKGVELVLQALIDTEATERIGAARYERTATRTTQRNGNRDRLLMTKAGDVELNTPSSASAASSRHPRLAPLLRHVARRVDPQVRRPGCDAWRHQRHQQ